MDDNKLIQENEPKDLSFTAIYGSQFRDYQEKVQEGEEPAAKVLPSSISEEDMQALQRSKEQVLIGRTAKRKLEESKLIARAQSVYAKKEGVSESEAYQILRKTAMDKRLPLAIIAKAYLEQEDPS